MNEKYHKEPLHTPGIYMDKEIEALIKILQNADSMVLTVKGQKIALGLDIINLIITAIQLSEVVGRNSDASSK